MSIIGDIFSIVYLAYITILIFLNIKGKVKLMLHPILAIMQGIMVTFTVNYLLLEFIQDITEVNIISIGILLAFSIFIGGFVATIFSKDNKTLFGIVTGIIFAVFILIVDYNDFMEYNITMKLTIGLIILLIVSMLPGGIGGFIDENSKSPLLKELIQTLTYIFTVLVSVIC
jgi:putative membrane protein (TIGR04086 family)